MAQFRENPIPIRHCEASNFRGRGNLILKMKRSNPRVGIFLGGECCGHWAHRHASLQNTTLLKRGFELSLGGRGLIHQVSTSRISATTALAPVRSMLMSLLAQKNWTPS